MAGDVHDYYLDEEVLTKTDAIRLGPVKGRHAVVLQYHAR